MFANFFLKHKNDNYAIYSYGVDAEGKVNDGEVEFNLKSWGFRLLKPATGDIESRFGFRGLWLAPSLCKEILDKGCPEKRFVMIG
jgi:hypothetical protein